MAASRLSKGSPGERASAAVRRAGARLTARGRVEPTYLVIGVKRGGTTSLQRYLAVHPQVARTNTVKASHYFDIHYDKGWAWYLSHFPRSADMAREGWTAVGEASVYYCFHPLAPERIGRHLPSAKLLMAVRDPVERAWSHYLYERARGFEDLPFAAALDAEPARLAGAEERLRAGAVDQHHRHHAYLARGRYAEQIERVLAHVPADALHVVCSEELFADPQGTMDGVHRFLGLDQVTGGDYVAFNANEPEPLDEGLRQRLAEVYAEENERLYALLGRRLPWSSPG